MRKSEVIAWLESNDVDVRTLSLACSTGADGAVVYDTEDRDDISDDPQYGRCDISGEMGDVYRCVACTKDGVTFEFDAIDALVGGHLGKIAGCF